jgi:hypothetical protein
MMVLDFCDFSFLVKKIAKNEKKSKKIAKMRFFQTFVQKSFSEVGIMYEKKLRADEIQIFC